MQASTHFKKRRQLSGSQASWQWDTNFVTKWLAKNMKKKG